MKPTCLLTILDGFGQSDCAEYNALRAAHTPHWDKLIATSPNTLLHTSGKAVGLPDGQMGNSEVGHMTIGAGRRILQSLVAIDEDIASGAFVHKPALSQLFAACAEGNRALHIIGLVSDGGVHSHKSHIEALVRFASHAQIQIYVHVITDGRDTAPKSAKTFIQSLESVLAEHAAYARIATVSGRYYAMDRDNNWDRVGVALRAMMHNQAAIYADTALDALEAGYRRGETDEFIQPSVMTGARPMQSSDHCVYMNFRADRARQCVQAMLAEANAPAITTLTEYKADLPVAVIYPPTAVNNHLGEWLAKQGKNQLRVAETEKYAHVTFFFNGGLEVPCDQEERVLIPSPAVATYDLQPEMSAPQVTDALIEAIGKYDCIICNFANCDMVGHTGDFAAAVKAVEAVDHALGRIFNKIHEVQGNCFVTADHGNAECMWNETSGQPHTAHTTNPVPFVHYGSRATSLKQGSQHSLVDIAPTLLACMGLPIPPEMTGTNLFA